MPSETETLALHLVRALYNATDGKPNQWRMLAGLDGATADAIEFAVARGWLLIARGHSVCLDRCGPPADVGLFGEMNVGQPDTNSQTQTPVRRAGKRRSTAPPQLTSSAPTPFWANGLR